MQQSFFEFLSISHQEKIHSQIISWIFSDSFTGISEHDKVNLLNSILKIECKKIEFSLTEYKNIDILIKTDIGIIIIENKLKSSQHSNQLKKYEEICHEDFKNFTTQCYFLTLIGEDSNNNSWKNISYKRVSENLHKLKTLDNVHSIIFKEYLIFLTKLVSVFADFENNYMNYKHVFQDGKKRKIDKINFKYPTVNEEFIAKNQLETIFQKCLLNKVGKYLKPQISNITDTRGEALIDFHLETFYHKNKKYNIFLQLQFDNLKFAIASDEYGTSNKKSIEPLIEVFEELKNENLFGYNKLNKPKSKAYISISKKMNPNPYWEVEYHQLLKIIEKEISNSKEIAKHFTRKWAAKTL